jgi:cytoskeletal protein RodZ
MVSDHQHAKDELARALRSLRQRAGLSVDAVAKAIGISPNYLRQVESCLDGDYAAPKAV